MYRGDLFLRGFDQDVREHLLEELQRNTDIDIQFQTDPVEIIKNNDNGDNIDSIDTVSILTKGGGIQGRVVTKIPASERSVGGSGGDIGMAATATTTAAAAESGGFFLNI